MAFFRKKWRRGRAFVYEVENVRGTDGKTRQRVIRYVGPVEAVYRTVSSVNYETLKQTQRSRRRRTRAGGA